SLSLLPRFPSSPSGRHHAGPTGGWPPPSPRLGRRRRRDPRRRCAVPHPRSDRLLQLRHAADPVEFNEPIHIVVAAPPQPPTQMQAGVNMSSKEDSGLPPTTSAFALTARLSCSTSRRRGASPRGSTLDQSPSAARVRKKPPTVEPELKLLPDPEFPRAWLWRCTPLWRGRRIRTPLSLAGVPNAVEGLSSSGAVR
uniref:Uncharacterized protein n=1 Tax=Oryza glaberrima TaxID=4538 RepID=I1Q3N9_ORYGL